jgi:hypothetical protein
MVPPKPAWQMRVFLSGLSARSARTGASNILKNLMDDTDVITTAQLEAGPLHAKSAQQGRCERYLRAERRLETSCPSNCCLRALRMPDRAVAL